MTIYNISGLVQIVHEKAITPTNIISGFKKTGIFPLNEHIFDECDFLPSLVTDQLGKKSHSCLVIVGSVVKNRILVWLLSAAWSSG